MDEFFNRPRGEPFKFEFNASRDHADHLSLSGGRWSVVVKEVAGARAEVGGDIAGIEQFAGAQ